MNTNTATEYRNLPLAVLTESATNPRRIFEDAALKELAESIRSQGVLSPLLVRPLTDQRFEIVAGARRYRAAQIAEASTVPVRIVHLTDAEALEAQLIEIELPILSVDAREFGQAFAATRTRAAQRRDALSTLDVRSIYNPLGKILAAGLPALMEYAARLHDIDALAHAVRAKGAVLALGVRANAVEGFLSAAGPELRDVYSQAPFHWQADPSVLDVPVRGSGSIARLSMRVASP